MESLGKPNMATDVLKQMKAELGDKFLKSKDEASAFMAQFATRHNESPKDDFLGLSSNQMNQILNTLADECVSIVKVDYSVLDRPSPTPVPLIEAAQWLLSKLESAPIKLTTAGYLPPSVAVPWWDEAVAPLNFFGTIPLGPVKKEGDRRLLGELRKIISAFGWMKERTGILSITKNGSQFLAKSFRDQYREVSQGVISSLDWKLIENPYFAPYHPMMRKAWLFNLYIIRKAGETGIFSEEAAEKWLQAFPSILEDYTLAKDGLEKPDARMLKCRSPQTAFRTSPDFSDSLTS
jgi:hypothetical protein